MRWCTWLVLLVPVAGLAVEPRTIPEKGPVSIGEWDVALVVKWADPVRARTSDSGALLVDPAHRSAELEQIIRAYDLVFEPWISLPPARLVALESRARDRSNLAQPDLAGLHRVSVANPTLERLQAAADALVGLDAVEFVAPESAEVPPPGDIAPETPDHTNLQGWIESDPGVDARAAWNWGLTGAGVRMSDCEYGWHHGHEDLVDGDLQPEAGQTAAAIVASRGWDHHGTAVAGELMGQHNGYGVDGLAPNAILATYPEYTEEEGSRRGTAIANAIDDSDVGDIVLLEMQAGGPDGRYAPAEVNQAVWTIVRLGVDAGVVVVGAAGNGAANLDSAPYDTYRSWGDSGAILVGAGTPDTTHGRLGFSTYGDRVNVHGWGRSVFTTGYGGFARYGGDNNQAYTSSFSGTSSASPFVAGSAALLQEMALRYRETPLAPRELRQLLADTGTPSVAGSKIGPLPNLDAALTEVEARLDILPAIVSVDGPSTIDEGETAMFTAEVELLPVHVGEVWWMQVADRTDGRSLSVMGVDDGEIPLTVHVRDDWARTASASVSLTVQNVAPTIESVDAAGALIEGAELTLAVSASDPGVEDVLTAVWTVDGQEVGTGASLAWTPADDGTYAVEVVVIDDDGGASAPESFSLTIEDVAPDVVIDGPVEIARKTESVFVASVVDPGDDTHTFAWTVDGEAAGTEPRLTTAFKAKGPHEISVVVTDDDGVSARASLTVEVVPQGGCGCSGPASPAGALAFGLGLVALWGRRRKGLEARP